MNEEKTNLLSMITREGESNKPGGVCNSSEMGAAQSPG